MNRKETFRLPIKAFKEYQHKQMLEKNLTKKQLKERRQVLASFNTVPPGTIMLANCSGIVTIAPGNAAAWKEAREQGDIFVEGADIITTSG